MEDEIAEARAAKRGSPYLSADQAAAYLGVSRRYLQKLRTAGEGPVYRRHSRLVQYHIDDLKAWSRDQAKGGGR
ncbi:DNA-binding protein [Sphingomonas gilva]|uniref:DNA-binding protein n=1 Tax=Sphingomonas gilva TaxID=2305907 RepID=A0A396RNU9_9SPHN|nr:helix-turn-helix domain-containing protein [Sphingomonas gilva]RHW18187.1 DNA-binding protein [Sphingomonas gilva]